MERFSPDLWATRFPGFALLPLLAALMFLTCKSSINTTAWFLLMSFEDLCTKSFLMLAILLCNRVTRWKACLRSRVALGLWRKARICDAADTAFSQCAFIWSW